ncbi:hypothetical protein LOTGIDRAFT_108840, partial [Lottia gigantea]
GHISDGVGNYSLSTKCSWLLDINKPNQTIWFHFIEFATECGWDHLYIHDGDSVFSPVLAAFSGLMVKASDNQTDKGFSVKVFNRYVYVHFSSDAAYTMAGFNISFSVNDCNGGCSKQGTCNNGKCSCNDGFTGTTCEIPICLNNCSNNGDCISGKCSCYAGFKGEDCSLHEYQSEWSMVESTNAPVARASHASITEGDSVWIVGGHTLSGNAEKNLARYDYKKKKWTNVPEKGTIPSSRYGHVSDIYKDVIYMYGGVSEGLVFNDLWKYDIVLSNWTQLTSSRYNISGHTAHIFDGTMFVFFGYSPKYSYLNIVQEYDIATDIWRVSETNGGIIQGGYGHTSVIETQKARIFIYGGYHSNPQSGYNLTDKLYMFNILTKTWTILRKSGSPMYFHSAIITNGLMLVFGGNTHNDTSVSHGAKCYSTDFMVYNIDCNSWHVLSPPNLYKSIARYGHTMSSNNGNVYIFGGFNGMMLNDILKYSVGKCGIVKDEETCNSIEPLTMCIWYQDKCYSRENLPDTYTPICNPAQGREVECNKIKLCSECQSSVYECNWCSNPGSCEHSNCTIETEFSPANCSVVQDKVCDQEQNCYSCISNPLCQWQKSFNYCINVIIIEKQEESVTPKPTAQCEKPCTNHKTCEACTEQTCMWCSNMKQCVDTDSYVVSFPYGQCMDWTTKDAKCPGSFNSTRCSGLKSCSDCQANSVCGWCNDPNNTGLGVCMEGGAHGPVDNTSLTNHSYCPAERWYFTQCPLCQCNGHSTCIENTDVCENCQDLTEGKQCEQCKSGYFGNPRNGGNCSVCECNGQADTCNRESGVCHCRTRGVTGDKCELCDKNHSYVGNPKDGGTCYYQLMTDFQFTFNLSKYEDRFFTQINFKNTPTSSDRDVDFTLNCSGYALINITTKSESRPEEEYFTVAHECDLFRTKFEHKDYDFAGDANTTFLVYVYAYKTPFWLVVSFSQFPKIDLVHFFVTFFSCFLSLLLIAAALWKIKHKYDSYRRRQLMIVEMQQMASRPFSNVTLDIERKKLIEPCSADKKEVKDPQDTFPRKRKKIGPGAIAIEPLHSNKAAVLSLIIQLPIGDEDYVPNGQTGIAIGSTIVTIGHTRKQSVEHIKGDKSKFRKHFHHTHPETCA